MLTLAYTLLFLLPFERIPSVDIAGVTLRLSTLVIVALTIWGFPQLIKKREITPFSKIDWTILAYWLVVLLSLFVATDVRRAIMVAAFITFVFVGYFFTSRIFRKQFNYAQISNVIVWTGLITALFGVFQFFGDMLNLPQSITGLRDIYTKDNFGFPRIQSVGLEPLYYADFLLFPIFILISRLLTAKAGARRFDMLALTIIGWVFILALSRGAYLAVLTGGAVLGLAMLLTRKAWEWKNVWPVVGCIALALVLSYGTIRGVSGEKGTQDFSSHAVNSPQTRDSSAHPRLERFGEAWRLTKERPILGWGVGNFGVVSKFGKPKEGYEIVNNQYLETLAETGVIGFLALISIAVAVIAKLVPLVLRKQPNIPALVLLVTLSGIAMQYNFFSTIYMLHVWVIVGLVDALPKNAATDA